MITELDKLAFKLYTSVVFEGYTDNPNNIKDFIIYKKHYIKYYQKAEKHLRKMKLQKLI
jgi:hypothetical protein